MLVPCSYDANLHSHFIRRFWFCNFRFLNPRPPTFLLWMTSSHFTRWYLCSLGWQFPWNKKILQIASIVIHSVNHIIGKTNIMYVGMASNTLLRVTLQPRDKYLLFQFTSLTLLHMPFDLLLSTKDMLRYTGKFYLSPRIFANAFMLGTLLTG